jgi:hypothetical protein
METILELNEEELNVISIIKLPTAARTLIDISHIC